MKYDDFAAEIRFNAFTNKWNGTGSNQRLVIDRCRRLIPGITCPDALIAVILTYDYGHHTCGMFKNSQFDECLHLSLSVCGYRKGTGFKMTRRPEQVSPDELRAWSEQIFASLGPDVMKWLWVEHGKEIRTVEHVRLFYSKITKLPILPEGEVYSLVPYDDGSSPEKVFNRCGM